MAVYTYLSNGAPSISVTLRPVGNLSLQEINCSALPDTGADTTMIPRKVLSLIGAKPTGRPARFRGFAGKTECLPYVISIDFADRFYPGVTVWGVEELDLVLIGRDLLNNCCAEFHGPKRLLEIRDHL